VVPWLSLWGKQVKKEPEYILVPAGFRERKSFWNESPRTYEQILTAEQEAAERKRLAEEQAAAEQQAFEAEKQRLEDERKQRYESA
jgi:hypothetical protein